MATMIAAMPISAQAAVDQAGILQEGLGNLEKRHGGRLGVAVLDTAQGTVIQHRGDERFALCSTHKFLSAAFVLSRVDLRVEDLNRRVDFGKAALVPYSPITSQHMDGNGLTVGELCEAALTLSDNTAANLLLKSFGGPTALTRYVRSIGDTVTRLDRNEPTLNEATPGDPRDTTSPVAMLQTIHRTLFGPDLSEAMRGQLIRWQVACKTGGKRLRAGVPQGWTIGDKTGSGAHGTTNDVAVIWPPGRQPIIITAFYTESKATDDERDAVIAAVGRVATASLR